MSLSEHRDILVVVERKAGPEAEQTRQTLRLPADASVAELLAQLEKESPAVYEEVRSRVLRSAARVLAFGHDDALLPTLARQLAAGGPVVLPESMEDEGCKASPTP